MAGTTHVGRATRLSQSCGWLMTFFLPSRATPYFDSRLTSFDERTAHAALQDEDMRLVGTNATTALELVHSVSAKSSPRLSRGTGLVHLIERTAKIFDAS